MINFSGFQASRSLSMLNIKIGSLIGILHLMISCGPSVEEKNQQRELQETREELARTKEEQKRGSLSLSATRDLSESIKLTEISLAEGFAQQDLPSLNGQFKPIFISSQSEIEKEFREVNRNAISYTAAASMFLKSVNPVETMPGVVSAFETLFASNQDLKSKILKLVQDLEAQGSLDPTVTKEMISETTSYFYEAMKHSENTDEDAKFLITVTFSGQIEPKEKN